MADPLGPPDYKVVALLPEGPIDPRYTVEAEDAVELKRLQFCCFFREEPRRNQFQELLTAMAATVHATPLKGRLSGMDRRKLMISAVTEICSRQRAVFHTYRLKAEFAPYRTSLLVSFVELDDVGIKLAVLRSLQELEDDKMRIMGMAGIEVGLTDEY